MAFTFAINKNGDTYLDGNGNITVLTGADAVGQNCVTAMRAQRAEMQYAMQDGMPMAATAFDSYNPVAFEAAARRVIKKVQGVTAITSFTVKRIENTLNYSATIQTIYGQTTIQGSQ
ncbi:gp09 [Burkholderia phage BcepB1A]|uniref:gp09 n=1 Tax=Burkholderia phage BcepB1A TaxID=279530 RepID=UPI00003779C0|nr:gp09 [Burkholderia phage BcepB1A]AAT37773.1 gp09 [Burkholderia phage BcepB1A]